MLALMGRWQALSSLNAKMGDGWAAVWCERVDVEENRKSYENESNGTPLFFIKILWELIV